MRSVTTRKVESGRGSKAKPHKRIDRLYYRGSRLRHEAAPRHARKAVMTFRGKGSKVERRQKKRKKR
jgi:hypothetical protein